MILTLLELDYFWKTFYFVDKTSLLLYSILKHLQSYWFLPMIISHDKNTAGVECLHHAPGWIHPLECRDLIWSWSDSSVIINHFWSHFAYLNQKCLRMRIKVLFLKRVWFVRPDKTRHDHYFCVNALVISLK